MKELYLDIIEKSLLAYTDERICDYISEVKKYGLTEHGFPRLGANIGILIAYGRKTELLDVFIEIMDICCAEMPLKKAANDFSVREVCCCLMLLEKKQVVSKELLNKWKSQLAAFNPWEYYSVIDDHSGRFVSNWAMFASVSEYIRGVYCGIDTSEFIQWQLPSQLANVDENSMYQDAPPLSNPIVYDIVVRCLMAFLLSAGYKGKYASMMEQVLDNTAEFTLKMQSVTGEIAYGGRSNQFLHNEAWLCAYCEMEATRFAKKGDMIKASEFKAAALLAAKTTLKYLNLRPVSHIKNRYDVASEIGCENYGYFNKYMITVASNVYMGLVFADDNIIPSVAPSVKGGYVIRTSEKFHKTFLSASGYQIEIETNADLGYDANGLGRVHKNGCPSNICLSVPFSPNPHYTLEGKNPTSMSICCYAYDGEKKFIGSESYADYVFLESKGDAKQSFAVFDVRLSSDIVVTHKYEVSKNGVDISLSGYKNTGFMIPVFDFDGEKDTEIVINESSVLVKYKNSVCKYCFEGKVNPDFKYYYNRNGRYRVYEVATQCLHIEMY